MALSAGTRLGSYEIIAPLGAGGMGEVYRAHDTRLHRDVALKVLPEGALTDDEARTRFHREANALSRLSHPHVAMLFDFGTADGTDFLVMELVRGPSMRNELEDEGALPERDVLRLGSQLARGLQAAHEQGIVHRDQREDLYKSRVVHVSAIRGRLRRVPVGGGESTEVVEGRVRSESWALGRNGVYYAISAQVGARTEYTIRYHDTQSGPVTELFRKEARFFPLWLAVSPDEEWVLYGDKPGGTSELMLVENFR